jgi:hypothetical protein
MGTFFNDFGKISAKGKLYQNLADPGSMLFGGAEKNNSLGMKRDGQKSGLFGDQAQGIDWFGSPVTAGTNMQGPARLAAILYGAWAGAGALGGGAAGSGSGAAGSGAAAGGAGSAAGGGSAAAGGGAVGGGAAGGTSAGATTGAGASGASSPAWMQWARMGANAGKNMMSQRQAYQPQQEMYEDGTQQIDPMLLAQLLRRG